MGFDEAGLVAELKLFTENDGDIYRSQTTTILKNLAGKKASGKYDRARAVDAFMALAETGAKKYAAEFGGGVWHAMFPMAIRKAAAEDWRDEFETEYDLGNYDHLVPKKAPKAAARAKAKRQAKVKSIVVVGKRWFQRGPGNTYCTAEILVNGKLVHKTEPEYGYGDYYLQAAGEWLDKNGYLPDIERYQTGGRETLWRYCERKKIAFSSSVSDVSRERDL